MSYTKGMYPKKMYPKKNYQSIQYTSGWFTTELGVDHHITLTRVGPYHDIKFQRFINFVAQNIPDEVYFKVIGELEKGKINPRRRKAHVKLMFSQNDDTDDEVRRVFDRLLKEFRYVKSQKSQIAI